MTQAAMDNDTMVAELLPCPSPWCNHRAYVASTDDDAFYGKAFQGRCTQCGMGGPVKRTEAEAVTAWNTRHQSGRTGAGDALMEARHLLQYARPLVGIARSMSDGGTSDSARLLCQRIDAFLSQSTAGEDGLDTVAQAIAKESGVSDWKHVAEHGDYDSRDYWRRLARAALGTRP